LKIVVTGAAGLLGSALRARQSHEIVPIIREELDLMDFDQVLERFQKEAPAGVIHAAALVGGIGGNLMRSGEYFFGNSQINLNVLEAARQVGISNLISFMSTCVFPDDATYPLTVDQLHQGPPHSSHFGYAYSKRMLEVQTKAYNQQWGTNYKVLIPANMYGPNDNFSLIEGHVVPALIHRTLLALENNSALSVWGSGKPLREFIYSDDVATIALSAMNKDLPRPLIVSNGLETSIRELVETIVDLMNFDGEIVWDTEKPDGQLRKPPDTSEMMTAFPGLHFTTLRQGLAQTIDWFLENFPNVRL
jgi:GDP-L-fucose synthase